MNRWIFAVVVISLSVPALAADPPAGNAPKQEFKTAKDKASYAIGLGIGRNMKHEGLALELSKLISGISDGLKDATPQLTDAEMQSSLQDFQKELAAGRESETKVAGAKNKKEGDAFLAANKAKAGVTTTKSGLQYEILKAGKGQKPTKADSVTTHYRGTLLNGTEFDSSIKRGEPATFPVSGVIPGWTEALQLMPVGSKWKLYVPAELAYGANGAGPDIGPNSTLVFEVELLGVGQPEEAGALPANP
jgi:FKBP-type peptidyl-prolyl cis-trans isomerase